MYTIYYIYENHMDTMRCASAHFLPYILQGIKEAGAQIICVKNNCGEPVKY